MSRHLFTRLPVQVTFLVLLLLSGIASLTYLYWVTPMSDQLYLQEQEKTELLASHYTEKLESAVATGDRQIIERTLNGLMILTSNDQQHFILKRIELVLASGEVIAKQNKQVGDSPTIATERALFSPTDNRLLGSVTIEFNNYLYNRLQQGVDELLWYSIGVLAVIALIISLVLRYLLSPLSRLASLMTNPDTATAYRKAPVTGAKEVRDLASAFNNMMVNLEQASHELRAANEELEARVEARTRELKAATDRVTRYNEENRKLINGMNSALEEERRYISRELHDHLNADLLFIKMRLRRVLTLSQSVLDASNIETHRADITNTLQQTIERIVAVYDASRNIVRMLRPEVIDSLGLIGAIKDRIDLFRSAQPGIEFRFDHQGEFDDLNYQYKMALFRMIQESLNNVVTHANATHAHIVLCRYCEENPEGIYLSIADDGNGFDPATVTRGTGLISMRERALSYGGQLIIDAAPGQGTTIRITTALDTTPAPDETH